MDVKRLTVREYLKLKSEMGISVIGNKAYKICPEQAIEVMRVVDIYKDKGNADVLLPDAYLSFKGMFVGYRMPYLKDYITVGDALTDGVKFNKLDIVRRVMNVVFELLDHEVSYVDMHVYNVMFKDDDVKVIDISDVSLEDNEIISYGLVEFIFNTLYGEDIPFFRLRNLVEDDRFREYFSEEFMDYVKLACEYKREVDARKILDYFHELEDEITNNKVAKLAKKLHQEGGLKYRL